MLQRSLNTCGRQIRSGSVPRVGASRKPHRPATPNPKSEARNPKQIPNPNGSMFKTSPRTNAPSFRSFAFSCFGFVSCFGFSASDFRTLRLDVAPRMRRQILLASRVASRSRAGERSCWDNITSIRQKLSVQRSASSSALSNSCSVSTRQLRPAPRTSGNRL